MNEAFFSIAYEAAKRSLGIKKGWGKVGAALVHKKHGLICSRPNILKTHPLLVKYTNFPFLHAESSCIIHHGMDNCYGCDLYITRVKKNGTMTMAKPCDICQALMMEVGIKNFYYTDWSGNFCVGEYVEKKLPECSH